MSIVRSACRVLSVYLIRKIRPAFYSNNAILSSILEKYGYNKTLIDHPELLFLSNQFKQESSCEFIWDFTLKIFAKSVRNDALHCPKGNAALLSLGMNPFFGRYVKNILEESAVPRIEYDVPKLATVSRKRVVYSVNTGKYDKPRELLYKNPDVDYLMFTNNRDITSNTWQIVYLDEPLDAVLLSRKVKMFPNIYLPKDYSESVYIDANSTIFGDISELCNYLSDNVSFAVTKHCYARSLLEEIDRCVKVKGINREKAMCQYERYLGWGFEDNIGFAECTILVRRHNSPELISLMEEWWYEFSNGIRRDQISLLPCVVHQSFKSILLMDGCVWNNQYCVIGGHNNQ